MPKGFNLRCAAGKTARVWLQGRERSAHRGAGVALANSVPSWSSRTSRNMTDGVRLRECRFRIPPKPDPEWLQQELVD